MKKYIYGALAIAGLFWLTAFIGNGPSQGSYTPAYDHSAHMASIKTCQMTPADAAYRWGSNADSIVAAACRDANIQEKYYIEQTKLIVEE